MKLQAGQTVLLTGATGGLGSFITRALAQYRLKIGLISFPGTGLSELAAAVEQAGSTAFWLAVDLRDREQRHKTLREFHSRFGAIDVLINNAGVEFTSAYHELPEERLFEILSVNLEAPMALTRLVLPEMIERRRGHIVNISSLAGKSGPAFQEPYSATKAALVAFTASLRATYRKTGVSASVIVPGFVEAGIYARLKSKSGYSAPALIGTSRPQTVARSLIRAILYDLPEVIVNPRPVRPLLAFCALFPSAGEWLTNQMGTNDFFQHVVDAHKEAGGQRASPSV